MIPIKITMKLFGAFRAYGDVAEFTVAGGSSVAEIKKALVELIGERAQALVLDSAVANDETILDGAHVINHDVRLSILPPVCGG